MEAHPEKKCDVIVVLGGDNRPDGTLTPMMRSRADTALRLWRASPGARLLATGGFGFKFNTTTEPHALHVMRYLQRCGVPEEAFLPPAISAHTVEDAVLSREVLAGWDNPAVCVVTSRFHGPRAHFIFTHFFPTERCVFVLAPNKRSPWRLWRHWRHERKWLLHLQQQGGVWVKDRFLPTPARQSG